MSLPWAGIPFAPGSADGFRLEATFFLPTDVWYAGEGRYYVADAGNQEVRVIGYDPETQEAMANEVFTTASRFDDYPITLTSNSKIEEGKAVFTTQPSLSVLSLLSLESEAVDAEWAGVRDQPFCTQSEGDARPPIGAPLGVAAGSNMSYVADPYCKTVWRIEYNGGASEVHDIRGEQSYGIGICADGPASFATFGAPMDVAIGFNGTIYVADAGCHSIRQITDLGLGQDLDAVATGLNPFLADHGGRLPVEAVGAIQEKLNTLDTDFLDANRFWVSTLAGSSSGKPGFADGPAAEAHFNAPTGIAFASEGATKY